MRQESIVNESNPLNYLVVDKDDGKLRLEGKILF
jgi:hypothetical protein